MTTYHLYRDVMISSVVPASMYAVAAWSMNVLRSPWYEALKRPLFQPPGWVFGVVWPILYLCIGIALFQILRGYTKVFADTTVLYWFGLHIFFHLAWSPAFLYWRSLLGSSVVLVCMFLSLLMVMWYAAELSREAVWILVPYALWLLFATVLNLSTWYINSNI